MTLRAYGVLGVLATLSVILLTPSAIDTAFAITTFSDKTSFVSATSATSATGTLPDLGKIGPAGTTQTLGSATLTSVSPATNWFIGTSGISIPNNDWTTLTTGNDIAISNSENLNVNFDEAVFAAGFEIVEPSCSTASGNPCSNGDIGTNWPTFIDSTFTVTLLSGATVVDTFSFNPANDVVAFVGVSSITPFERMEIRETTGNADNEYFGEFFTSNKPLATLDIKPTSCPNPINTNSKGVLPVAVLGTSLFDVSQVDVETVELEGVSPLRSSVEDVATPFSAIPESADDCNEDGQDGFNDLTLKFDSNEVVSALGPVSDGEVRQLALSADLLDGTPIELQDVVVILDKGKP